MTGGGPSAAGVARARLLRGSVAGVVSGLGAAVAHQLAGGHAGGATVGVIVAVSVLGGLQVARRPIGAGAAVAVTALAQGVAHLVLAGVPHEDHMAMGGPGHPLTVGGLTMLLGHVAIAALTVAVVLGADRGLLELARAVAWRVVSRMRPTLGPVPLVLRPRIPVHEVACPRWRPDTAPLTRRGPPARPIAPLLVP